MNLLIWVKELCSGCLGCWTEILSLLYFEGLKTINRDQKISSKWLWKYLLRNCYKISVPENVKSLRSLSIKIQIQCLLLHKVYKESDFHLDGIENCKESMGSPAYEGAKGKRAKNALGGWRGTSNVHSGGCIQQSNSWSVLFFLIVNFLTVILRIHFPSEFSWIVWTVFSFCFLGICLWRSRWTNRNNASK